MCHLALLYDETGPKLAIKEVRMPLYEYHCHTCKTTFELLRPMSDASSTAICPSGHKGAGRVVSLVATLPRTNGGDGFTAGSGCACGGNCSCGH
jgi:putative FmdB family regulatory protein